jgi:acetyl-CoA acetyltransferase
MQDAYLIGTSCTRFGKQPAKSFKDLTREAYLAVLADAGLDSGDQIGNAWFGNCGMAQWGQGNIRGQVCFTPLVRDGLFPERVGMTNVEGGCATASMALHGAWKDVLSGTAELSLAMGVEKTYVPDTIPDAAARQQAIFDNGIDQLDPADWMAYYAAAGEDAGKPFAPQNGGGTLFMDTYAMQAAWHMRHHGSTVQQIAFGAAKNHAMGALNPLAQYRFTV